MRYAQIIPIALITLLMGCTKEGGCPDERMRKQHRDDICTMDCPGVCGCDGRSYCNECIARREGVTVVPC
jgi:hypothetical protein